MNKTITAIDREKAENKLADDSGIRVKITYPENVPEAIRQEKINRIYDILAKHSAE